jgi:hypothetical protein
VTLAHDRTRYQQGCRCSVCTAANKVYTSEYRQRRRMSGVRVSAVPSLNTAGNVSAVSECAPVPNGTPGPCVAAVLAEVDLLGVLASRPALCAAAAAMAAILDNQKAITSQPSACRQLTSVMDELHKSAQPRRGRLAAITTMTSRSPDAG